MGVVVIKDPQDPTSVWKVGGWAYSWLLVQAMAASRDKSMRDVFERAIALEGLHLHRLNKIEAERVRHVLLSVAKRATAGELPPVEVEGRVLDEDSQKQFKGATAELVRMLAPD